MLQVLFLPLTINGGNVCWKTEDEATLLAASLLLSSSALISAAEVDCNNCCCWFVASEAILEKLKCYKKQCLFKYSGFQVH